MNDVDARLGLLVESIANITVNNPNITTQGVEGELTRICREYSPEAKNRAYAETIKALAEFPGIDWQTLLMSGPEAVVRHVTAAWEGYKQAMAPVVHPVPGTDVGPPAELKLEAPPPKKTKKKVTKKSKPKEKEMPPPVRSTEQLPLVGSAADSLSGVLSEVQAIREELRGATSGVHLIEELDSRMGTLEEMLQMHRQETANEMAGIKAMIQKMYREMSRTILNSKYSPPETL